MLETVGNVQKGKWIVIYVKLQDALHFLKMGMLSECQSKANGNKNEPNINLYKCNEFNPQFWFVERTEHE